MKKIYFKIYFFLIALSLNSCQNELDQSYNNKRFEKNYSKDVTRINRERTFNEKENPEENLNTLLTPSSQEQRTSNITNSFDYVDISQIGSKKQEKYLLDDNTSEASSVVVINKPYDWHSSFVCLLGFTTLIIILIFVGIYFS